MKPAHLLAAASLLLCRRPPLLGGGRVRHFVQALPYPNPPAAAARAPVAEHRQPPQLLAHARALVERQLLSDAGSTAKNRNPPADRPSRAPTTTPKGSDSDSIQLNHATAGRALSLPGLIFHRRRGGGGGGEGGAGQVVGGGKNGEEVVMAGGGGSGRNDVWALGSGTAAVGGAVLLGGTLFHLRSEDEHRRRIDTLKSTGGSAASSAAAAAAVVSAAPVSSPLTELHNRAAPVAAVTTFDVDMSRLQENGGDDNGIKVAKGGAGRAGLALATGASSGAGNTAVPPTDMATKSGASPDLRLLESQGLRRAFRIIGPHRDRVAYGLLQQPGMYVCMLEKTWLGETQFDQAIIKVSELNAAMDACGADLGLDADDVRSWHLDTRRGPVVAIATDYIPETWIAAGRQSLPLQPAQGDAGASIKGDGVDALVNNNNPSPTQENNQAGPRVDRDNSDGDSNRPLLVAKAAGLVQAVRKYGASMAWDGVRRAFAVGRVGGGGGLGGLRFARGGR